MKKLGLFLIVLAIIALPVFANGQSEQKATGPRTLSVLLSEEPSSGDALSLILDKWAAETGNKVERLVIPYDDQITKFPLMAKNKDLPDLVATTRLTRLYPDEFLDLSTVINMAIFEPQAVAIIGQDYTSNKNLCLPQQFTITNVYYNADAFKKAGIEVPTVDDPWTLDELYANAKLLQEKGGVKYGMAMDASRARYDNMIYMNGGSITVKNGNSFAVNVNSKANVEALEKFIEWNNTVMPKAIWAGGTNDNPADYFKNGDVGIYFSGSWQYNGFYQDIKAFNWGVMPSPVGAKGPSAIMGGSGLAVPANADGKDLAIEFLKWFYEDSANFQEYLNNDKGLSSLKDVTYSPADPKVVADYKVLQSEVAKVSDAFNVDEQSNWRNYYDNEYRDALRQAVYGSVSAKDSLDDFANKLSKKSGWPLAK
ncbi:ABC transporter substrate-binding protein [Bullifex porci]|uniref:Extracellular solute-binding protein n=1 Tax=Bullifex porci TaxID=2606638 RepID=A0A7X2TRD9_9SPIO|nr:extracellular solute-binding protein [Bullifex porci]MDD7256484.1 extracellular solute-binding protein [Bullifex porci]MDD7588726.1 extracellular solute-binding protein [Bullifex porci]MDY2741102.1 extracellular solute-binding protein [Bullifex porci]MSU05873.1 extracellular solute-binding protein [Bullifex porci]